MKYKLLKDLPFMREGAIFERQCKDDTECCVFGTSFHNCVKHYNTIQFSENENAILCGIIDKPDWIEIVPEKGSSLNTDYWCGRDAVEAYDSGHITHEQLIEFIEAY